MQVKEKKNVHQSPYSGYHCRVYPSGNRKFSGLAIIGFVFSSCDFPPKKFSMQIFCVSQTFT